MTRMRFTLVFAVLISLGVGCQADTDDGEPYGPGKGDTPMDDTTLASWDTLTDVQVATQFSHPGSAVAMFMIPIFIAEAGYAGETKDCPAYEETSGASSASATYTGGCVKEGAAGPEDDVTWLGKATIRADASGTTEFIMEGFGFVGKEECNSTLVEQSFMIDGTMSLDGSLFEDHQATAIYLVEITGTNEDNDCAATDFAWASNVDYERVTGAVVEGQYTEESYSGQGSFSVDTLGSWTAVYNDLRSSTVDNLPDDAETNCEELLDGNTTLTAGSDVAVIQFDGATACTVDACAPWTRNGTAQAEEVCDVGGGCSMSLLPTQHRRPSGGLLGLILLGGVAMGWRRRRVVL